MKEKERFESSVFTRNYYTTWPVVAHEIALTGWNDKSDEYRKMSKKELLEDATNNLIRKIRTEKCAKQ